MINVGLIGASGIANTHARAIAQLPEKVRLVATADIDAARLEAFVGAHGGKGYPSYEAMLADPAVEAVCITLPHHLHRDAALKAAAAGKHILEEKPMGVNVAQCDEIIAAAKAAGVKLMVGQTQRFYPGNIVSKDILRSGEMGGLLFGIGTFNKNWGFPNRRFWYKDRAFGGGMWLTNGVHIVDLLTWLAGSDVVAVKAMSRCAYHDQKADDTTMAMLQYSNGVYATAVLVGYSAGVEKFDTELYCTGGQIRSTQATVSLGRDERWESVDMAARQAAGGWSSMGFVNEWAAFAQAIETNTEPEVTGEWGRMVMRVLVAAEESAATGREVRLD